MPRLLLASEIFTSSEFSFGHVAAVPKLKSLKTTFQAMHIQKKKISQEIDAGKQSQRLTFLAAVLKNWLILSWYR